MIKILYKYIVKNFVKVFIFTAIAFSVVVIVSQLLGKIDFYMENKATFGVIIVHMLTNTPEWLVQTLPVTTLLALLFSLSSLTKRNEITAMKAVGVNIWSVISLFLTIGFFIGVTDFACREFIVPKTTVYNRKIDTEKIKKEKSYQQTDFYNQIIALKNNARLTVGHLDIKTNTMKNVVFERYNKNFELKRLVLSEKANWENGFWVLKNGIMRCFESNFLDEVCFKTYSYNINVTPEDIAFKDVPYNSMNIANFKKYINQLKIFGQSTIKARIALNTRFASVFSNVIVMMIGIPFALGFGGGKINIIFNFLVALSAIFMYWATQAITTSFGKNLILSDFMAAWLPDFIFLGIGFYLLIKVKK
ncbi:MAG: LptF/LptG family permease [Endomicrobium sp.]|jgi:lipopolysaccharide export system permease protein|nr:LptF/LptG family permease [Endomicrobium sp.]